LAVSGLPVDRFCFEGFLPRRTGPRDSSLTDLVDEQRTMVFFEAPHRLAETLEAMATAFGEDRPGAICREITKTYEQIVRGSLAELVDWAQGEVRGEITIVIAGALGSTVPPAPALLAAYVQLEEQFGKSRKDSIASIAQQHGVPKRVVFDAVVAAKLAKPPDK
jgi:16S rRNA (cytidine1402-2'-O)-methyltransferase